MRPPHYLVVSCGSSHVAAVHLSMHTSGRCELLNYWRKELDLSLSDPLLWLKAASQLFGEARAQFNGDMPVGYALPGNLVLTKYLKVPQAPLNKRDKIVAFEAKQNIPYPIGEVAWDSFLIEEDDLDFETVIAASKSELVESLSLYGKQAKMDPDLIEPAFVGLINAFRFNEPQALGCSLLVSIGAKSTDIVFFNGPKFYSRNVSLGGNTVTQEIRSALELPFEDAERIKRAAVAGEPLPVGEHSAFEAAQQSFLKRLNVEVSRTQAIYKNHGYDDSPVRCLLTGGGSLLPEIATGLENRIGVPVTRFDPLKEVRPATGCPAETLNADKVFLAEAIGVAIGRFLPDSTQLNLLPRSILWQRRFRKQQPYYIFAGIVACAAIALPLVNTKIAVQRYEEEIQNLDTKIQPLRELNTRINQRIEEIEGLRNVIGEASVVAQSRSNWMLFLNDIQTRLDEVEDVWLDRIEVDRPVSITASPSNRFNSVRDESADAKEDKIRLHLEGRLLDVANPLSTVSQESNKRVSALLDSFIASEFVERLENERFDNNVPGILKFNFTLVVDSTRPL